MRSRSNFPRLSNRRAVLVAGAAGLAVTAVGPAAWADDASEIVRQAREALDKLYAGDDTARALGARSRAVLVFPEITKAGFIVGGENGQGVMFVGPRVAGFFQISAGSFGLQAGAQKYGYALFFLNDKAIDYVRSKQGFSIGTGPSVVLVDKGFARSMNTTTLRKDVYAVAFDQRGLMGGLGLQGSKISEIEPPK